MATLTLTDTCRVRHWRVHAMDDQRPQRNPRVGNCRNGGPPTSIEKTPAAGLVTSTQTVTVPGGQGVSHTATDEYANACRFVVTGSTKKIRAAAFYFDGTNYRAALLAR